MHTIKQVVINNFPPLGGVKMFVSNSRELHLYGQYRHMEFEIYENRAVFHLTQFTTITLYFENGDITRASKEKRRYSHFDLVDSKENEISIEEAMLQIQHVF